MQGRVGIVVSLVCLLALAPVVAGTGGAITSTDTAQATGPQPGAAVQESIDPDVVVMRATVDGDGTAAWAVSFRVRLDDENATTAFESLQADVEANSSAYTERFSSGMARTVAAAENRTGREMRLENLTVEATTEQFGQEYGVLTYRFTWTNFAAVEGDNLHVGDALSGLFLDSKTSLVLAWPESYAVESVRPDPDETRDAEVVWHGRLDFGPDQPRVVLAPAGGGPSVVVLVAGALTVLALLAAGWVAVSRRRGGGFAVGGSDDAAAPGGTETDAAASEPPEDLLSNEERVLRLLEDNGGRIKQQRIAEEFDWTDAKTSQVVGSLRDDDAVETFRIGRENVVTLPEDSDL